MTSGAAHTAHTAHLTSSTAQVGGTLHNRPKMVILFKNILEFLAQCASFQRSAHFKVFEHFLNIWPCVCRSFHLCSVIDWLASFFFFAAAALRISLGALPGFVSDTLIHITFWNDGVLLNKRDNNEGIACLLACSNDAATITKATIYYSKFLELAQLDVLLPCS